MSTPSDEWGPRLFRHLEAIWRAAGSNQNAWCYAHEIQAPTVSRWGTGSAPSLQGMQTVADALGLSMLDVLLIAGVVDKKDVTRNVPAAATITRPEVAIEEDPTLTPWQKKTATDILTSLRAAVAATESEERRPRGRKSRS